MILNVTFGKNVMYFLKKFIYCYHKNKNYACNIFSPGNQIMAKL